MSALSFACEHLSDNRVQRSIQVGKAPPSKIALLEAVWIRM